MQTNKERRTQKVETKQAEEKNEREVERSRRDAENGLIMQRQALRFMRRIEEGWDTSSAKLYVSLEVSPDWSSSER